MEQLRSKLMIKPPVPACTVSTVIIMTVMCLIKAGISLAEWRSDGTNFLADSHAHFLISFIFC